MDMACPKCSVEELHREVVHLNDFYRDPVLSQGGFEKQIDIFQCFLCKGMWFGAGKLEEILAEKVTILRTLDPINSEQYKKLDAQPAKCPQCRTLMTKKKAPVDSAVICDYCETCHGTWLDSGEIDDLEMKNITLRDRFTLFLHGLGIRS